MENRPLASRDSVEDICLYPELERALVPVLLVWDFRVYF